MEGGVVLVVERWLVILVSSRLLRLRRPWESHWCLIGGAWGILELYSTRHLNDSP